MRVPPVGLDWRYVTLSLIHTHVHAKWQMANSVRTATNVVIPPSPYRLGTSGRYTEVQQAGTFGIFPGARLGTCRNSSTVPLVWYWHPKSNLDPYYQWDGCFCPFFATPAEATL